jgi:hypothetical protein
MRAEPSGFADDAEIGEECAFAVMTALRSIRYGREPSHLQIILIIFLTKDNVS